MDKGNFNPENEKKKDALEEALFDNSKIVSDSIKALKALKLNALTDNSNLVSIEQNQKKFVNILLVEDNKIDAAIYMKMLKNEKTFKITHVENIRTAIDSLVKGDFQIIVLDLSLPDEEGYATFKRLSEHAHDIPVIVLTGLDNEELALQIMQNGAQDYLLKGNVNRELLIRSVRYAIERYKLLERIYNLSLMDELTGLYNRRAFMIIAERYLNLAKRKSCNMLLFFIDLDNMKIINDNYGHLEGDNAIKNTAEILRRTFRDSDLVARTGGDEFIAMMFIDDLETSFNAISWRLKESVANFNSDKNNLYDISLSVGGVFCKLNSDTTLKELIDKADSALYEHKKMKNTKERVFINLSR